MYMYSIMGTKNSKATILFCIVCVISADVVMIVFNIAREQKSPTSSSMSREDEGSGTVGCSYWQVAEMKCMSQFSIKHVASFSIFRPHA